MNKNSLTKAIILTSLLALSSTVMAQISAPPVSAPIITVTSPGSSASNRNFLNEMSFDSLRTASPTASTEQMEANTVGAPLPAPHN